MELHPAKIGCGMFWKVSGLSFFLGLGLSSRF
jgi:hypothetical protein